MGEVLIGLPVSADTVTDTLFLSPHHTLLTCQRQEGDGYPAYYAVSVAPIAGSAQRPQLKTVKGHCLTFLCRDGGNCCFLDFPYLLEYEVRTGERTRHEVWQDPREPLEFGGVVREGHQLLDLTAQRDSVLLRFRTLPEHMAGGPIDKVPLTRAAWDEAEGALVLRIGRTEVAPGLTVVAPGDKALLRGCRVLTGVGEGDETEVRLLLTAPHPYNVDFTFEDEPTMTLRFRPSGEN